MRTVDYVSQIKESADELKELENKEKNPRLRKRLQLLRILKSGLTPLDIPKKLKTYNLSWLAVIGKQAHFGH